MYFITNNEGLIIAASSEFMSKVGSRDVCSLSNMLSDKLIDLKDDNELSIKNSDVEFSYTKTIVHSAFGDLELYRLLEKNRQTIEAENDESIAYLKKIKEGSIVKEDNEYSVPNIPTLEEDKNRSDNDVIKEIEESNISYKESIAKIDPEDRTLEIERTNELEPQENTIKIPEIPKEAIEESLNKKPESNTDTQINIDNLEPEKAEVKDILSVIDTDDNKESTETTHIVEEKTAEDSKKEKKQGLFSSNLFPWGKKKKTQEDVLEENIKSIIEPKEQEKNIVNEEISTLNNKIPETKNQEIAKDDDSFDDNFLSIFKDNAREDIQENKKVVEETTDITDTLEDVLKADLDENLIKKPIADDNDKIDIVKKENDKPVSIQEDLDKIDTQDSTTIDVNKDEHKELTDKEEINKIISNEIIETIEDKKEDIKTDIDNITPVELLREDNSLKDVLDVVEAKEEELETKIVKEESNKADSILEKIINIQVDTINLEENAKKLNIDLSSYKMLLNSYLSEIDKYLPQLEKSDKQTIDMLIDAGQLLSLDSVTSKLSKLKALDKDEKSTKIKELQLFNKQLKNKLNNKSEEIQNINTELDKTTENVTKTYDSLNIVEKETEKVIKNEATTPITNKIEDEELVIPKPKMVKIEDTYSTSEKTTENIESKSVEITSAQELLEVVEPIDVNLNPKIAAEELNLPEELIVEFINDFLAQSKEHLPIIVDSYIAGNIDKVQSTAHMLKGAANNLRLNKIADNLFKIQKEKKLENDTELIKKFVAQIKGLEIELKKIGE